MFAADIQVATFDVKQMFDRLPHDGVLEDAIIFFSMLVSCCTEDTSFLFLFYNSYNLHPLCWLNSPSMLCPNTTQLCAHCLSGKKMPAHMITP